MFFIAGMHTRDHLLRKQRAGSYDFGATRYARPLDQGGTTEGTVQVCVQAFRIDLHIVDVPPSLFVDEAAAQVKGRAGPRVRGRLEEAVQDAAMWAPRVPVAGRTVLTRHGCVGLRTAVLQEDTKKRHGRNAVGHSLRCPTWSV